MGNIKNIHFAIPTLASALGMKQLLTIVIRTI